MVPNKRYDEKKKEIKEITIRGLEPELQRMLASHQKEMKIKEENFIISLEKEKLKLKNEYGSLKEKLELDLQIKEENMRNKFEKTLLEEGQKRFLAWEAEKERMNRKFEIEMEQKEIQRKIEIENYQLKIQLLQENLGKT